MKPRARCTLAEWAQTVDRLSQRRAAGLIPVHNGTLRYRRTRDRQDALRQRLRELAAARVRLGYRRLPVLLKREGCLPSENQSETIDRARRGHRCTPLVEHGHSYHRGASTVRGFVALRRSLNPEFLHPELKSASFEAKAVGRPPRSGQRPMRPLQCGQDVGPLGLFERLL